LFFNIVIIKWCLLSKHSRESLMKTILWRFNNIKKKFRKWKWD